MKKILLLLAVAFPIFYSSCSTDEPVYEPGDGSSSNSIKELDGSTQDLIYGETLKLPMAGEWTSKNTYIAKIENNEVKAMREGTTQIFNEEQGVSFKVTVEPTNNLLANPYFSFGSSQSTVESKIGWPVSSNKMIKKGNYIYQVDTYNMKIGDIFASYYYYYGNTDFFNLKLDCICIVIDESATTDEIALDWTRQRYYFDSNNYFYTTDDKVKGYVHKATTNDSQNPRKVYEWVFYSKANGSTFAGMK